MGCNSSKGIQVGTGSKEGSWSSFPLMRSLSRSFSMPPMVHQQIRPAAASESSSSSHSFHSVALSSSTLGLMGLADKYPDFAPSEPEEEELDDEDSASTSGADKPGQDHRMLLRVREPEVIDVWELLEDLHEDEDEGVHSVLVNKRHKRAKKNHFAKSTSMPAIRSNDELGKGPVHGLPLVLECKNLSSNQGVFHRVSPTKSQEAARKPPLPPSSSASRLRKYSSSFSSKQDEVEVSAASAHRRSLSCASDYSHRSSGYCTPSEEFTSPPSSPGQVDRPVAEYGSWCLVDDSKQDGSRSSLDKSCVSSIDHDNDQSEVSSIMKHQQQQGQYAHKKPQQQQQQQKGDGFLRDSTNLKDWQQGSGELSLEKKKPGVSLLESFDKRCPPGGEDRVVLYFTSLQSIRKTYEHCKSVKLILVGLFVDIDERDVSMHSEFRDELKELLRGSVARTVPRLFVRGRYIGGAEEVMQLNENGMVAELLEGLPKVCLPRKVCEGCGGIRFIPCIECSGSCKVVDEDNDRVLRCEDCNENGLIRCPICY